MILDKERLLSKLELVQPGLSLKGDIQQSECFCFKDGEILTFNGEVACRMGMDIPLEGAVPAKPLMELLKLSPEEELEVEATDSELLVVGKEHKSGITLERDIMLRFDAVEKPGKWRELPDEFADAVGIVQQCASKDTNYPRLMCVHIHPSHMEAFDNYQAARYMLELEIKEAVLIKRDNLKQLAELGASHVSVSEHWVHFKNKMGLVISCRRSMEEPLLSDKVYRVKGDKMGFPKGMKSAVEMAAVLAEGNEQENNVLIELKKGKVRITGRGPHGWHQRIKPVKYQGRPLKFLIAPEMIGEISSKSNECIVSKDKLKVAGPSWEYVTALGQPEE